MRLKHLQLQGYKTFATKTGFLFPSGITAIIGPNGSGKSNIADAVRWVLGEQSYTALRGKRTEDMIFSGSQSRPRAGMAEVILTLDNSDMWLPVEFSEVTVSRRAYRDGQNEYCINGNRVRLRDVSELLSQSGLSRRTYTIIGQGLVDAVLSLSAQERRALFEEAAGIAHYRGKQADALRKLDETQRNLERVQDIIAEIEPRLQRLQGQAERTREHQKLSAHLEHLLRIWYGYRWGHAITALIEAQSIANQRSEQHEKRAQGLQMLIHEIDAIRETQSHLRQQMSAWRHQTSLVHAQLEENDRELAVLAERSHQLLVQREEHLDEIAALDVRLAAQTQRVTEAREHLRGAQQALDEDEKKTQKAHAALDALAAEHEKLSTARNELQAKQAVLHTELTECNTRRETLTERGESLIAQINSNRAELVHLNDELTTLSSQISRVDAKLTHIYQALAQAQHKHKQLVKQEQSLTERLDRQLDNLRRLRETEAQITARFELLSQLRRDFVVYGQAARALLTLDSASDVANVLPGIKGVLAQVITVRVDGELDPRAAVEAALGVYASAIIVADWRTAARALNYIRGNGIAGRVALLALEPPDIIKTLPRPPQAEELGKPISEYVQCDVALRPLVDRLLGSAYLVPDLRTAEANLVNLPVNGLFVTPEGEVLRSIGFIEGGRTAEHTSPFVQEQEWWELNTRRIKAGARREALEKVISQSRSALEAAQRQIRQSTAVLDNLGTQRTAALAVRDKVMRQTDQLRHEITWRESQVAEDEAEIRALRQRQGELASEVAELTRTRATTEAEIEDIIAKLATLSLEKSKEKLITVQMALAAARQAMQGQQSILSELETNLDRLHQEHETRHRRIKELRHEERTVEECSTDLQQIRKDLAVQQEALSAQIEPAEARLVELEKEQRHLEAHERADRARLREFESHLTSTRLEVQRQETVLAQLRDRIEEDLGLVELEPRPSLVTQTQLPLHPLVAELPAVEQLPEGLEDEVNRLRVQLRRLGAINPNAPEDYEETKERYDFLQGQSSDLVEASDSLRGIIAEMDGLIEHAFRQTFDATASEFSAAFVALFGGGQARLELSDPDDLAQTGVEIVAQPPGKRLQALASLSGGERALTAVALIFSILKICPTPFCFLDEVDAMLDEANISRFRSLLESLTEHTQIVIITHNRGTISAADTVYGISMGSDSVSQVYSMQLQGEELRQV